MSSRRVLKVAEAIREVVGMAVLTELRDPRIRDVTVTYVEVSADLRYAKVHVSVMGSEAKQNLSLRGLQNAAGFLQQKVARRIETRYTPKLTFLLDKGVKHSLEISRLLSELLPPASGVAAAAEGSDPSGDEESLPAPASESLPAPVRVEQASLEQDATNPGVEESPDLDAPQQVEGHA